MDSVRRKGGPGPSSKTLNLEELDPAEYYPDGRFNHNSQVQERLNFIRFLLRDGQLWLCSQHWPLIQEEAGAALSAPRGREGALKISAEIRLAGLSLLGIFLQCPPRPPQLPLGLTKIPAADRLFDQAISSDLVRGDE